MIATETPRSTFPRQISGAGTVSVIVPVLNEASCIEPFLRRLRQHAAGAEIIIVDGGSSDRTREIASPLCDQFVLSKPGRAEQLNSGAQIAHGDIFWFLHVDCQISPESLDAIRSALRVPDTSGGYFRISIPRAAFVYRLTDSFAHHAGNIMRVRCGDHGYFCRRETFAAVGGFPNVPLMEDVEFFRALGRLGCVRATEARLAVSPRRYEKVGPWRLTLSYGVIATLYALGFPLSLLARLYVRLCCRARRT